MRFLHYISQEYLRFVDYTGQNIYGEKIIKLPTPHFVVFYNGEKELPDEKILHLSDAYETENDDNSLEVTVKMINVNYGKSNELMKKCSKLEEYAIFIHQVRENMKKGMKLNKAVDEAIFHCIECGVLEDYLKRHRFRTKMYGMLEYGSDRHMYMERRDARAEGRAEGKLEGVVMTYREFGVSYEEALLKIMNKFDLKEEEAKELLQQYW